ncbi:synaptotagmin-15-like isoform X1 [Dermacentor albipictus]|uniref:synaptotagmin-15-like isoform X1 n=2 Tax=Dermacentor albipictus TaxID=60249 RepID=UPI0031FCA199
MSIDTTESSTGVTILEMHNLSGVYVWVITAGIVTGALLLGLVVWLVVFRLRRAKRNSESAEPPLLTREPWHRKSMLSQPLAGVLPTKSGGLDLGPAPPLLTPESFDVQPAQLTVAEPVQPLARPGFVRWNSFCSPSAEGLVGNLMPKGCNVGSSNPDQTRTYQFWVQHGFCRSPRSRGRLFMHICAPGLERLGEAQKQCLRYSWSDDEDATVPRCTNGRLWFSLNYKPESEELDVNVIKAKYLPGRGLTNTPRDPFVRAYLLPDEDTFQQSTVKTRTLAPKFNETLTFKISEGEARTRSLRLSVYDIDRKKVRHCLGHVTLQLEKEPLTPDKVIWLDLDNVPKKSSQIGEIQICMTCNPFTNRIRASILKVRKFSKKDDASKWVYVRLSLNHGRKCVKEKRSENREWGTGDEASFGDAFTFGVAGRYFDSCSLSFTVMVSPDGADFRRLGKTVLGPFMYARGEELRHWQDMLTNPRSAVTRWHALECPTGRDEWKSD